MDISRKFCEAVISVPLSLLLGSDVCLETCKTLAFWNKVANPHKNLKWRYIFCGELTRKFLFDSGFQGCPYLFVGGSGREKNNQSLFEYEYVVIVGFVLEEVWCSPQSRGHMPNAQSGYTWNPHLWLLENKGCWNFIYLIGNRILIESPDVLEPTMGRLELKDVPPEAQPIFGATISQEEATVDQSLKGQHNREFSRPTIKTLVFLVPRLWLHQSRRAGQTFTNRYKDEDRQAQHCGIDGQYIINMWPSSFG